MTILYSKTGVPMTIQHAIDVNTAIATGKYFKENPTLAPPKKRGRPSTKVVEEEIKVDEKIEKAEKVDKKEETEKTEKESGKDKKPIFDFKNSKNKKDK